MWRRAVALHFFTFHSSLFTCPSRECSAGLAVLRFPWRKPAPPPGTLRWARFLPDEKSGKESPKAGPSPALCPPCGIHPAVLAVPACSSFRPLDGWGHMDGMEVPQNIPASVETCTSIAGALPWCAAVPSDRGPGIRRRERRFSGVRPWKERHHLTEKGALPIDLPGHPCDPTRAWADHSLDAGPASYPREVLRGERPKWLFVHFGQSKWTPSGKRPHRAGKPELGPKRRTIPL